jgi:hypothetical protein
MGRFKELGAWVVAIMLAGAFLLTGGIKLIGSPDMIASFARWGYGTWFMYGIGVIEVLSAIALLIPPIAFFGALGILGVMVGALVTHVSAGEYAMIVVPIALGAMAAWLAWTRRPTRVGARALRTRTHEFVSAAPEDRIRRR